MKQVCTGIGLHSGHPVNLTIKPAPADTGITFMRKDVPSRPSIRATLENVVDTRLSTTSFQTASGCQRWTSHGCLFRVGLTMPGSSWMAPKCPSWMAVPHRSSFCCDLRHSRTEEPRKTFSLSLATSESARRTLSIRINPSQELKISLGH